MENIINYPVLTQKIIDTISAESFDINKALNKRPIDIINKIVGIKLNDKSNSDKARIIKAVLKILGIVVKGNTTIVYLSNATIKEIIKQLIPYVRYFSKALIRGLIAKINKEKGVKSSDSSSIPNFMKGISKDNKLADYLYDLLPADKCKYPSTNMELGNNQPMNTELTTKEAALKDEVQRLKKQLEKRNISAGSNELFIERLEDSILSVSPSVSFITDKWKGDNTFKHGEHATEVLHISDWHIGEQDNIGGFNQFNYDIACERVKTLTNKVISWTKMHRSMYNVDELVIIATGDMISGEIHDELKVTNEFPAPEQCVKAAMLISKMTNELSAIFKKVRVEYIVADNHSRTTKKIEFAPGTNSYNYIIGEMCKIYLRDNDAVEFNVYPEIQHVVKVEGLKYLITHGNSIRGGFAGIPYYGMNRKLGAEALIRMNMPDEYHFNRIIMGHYHTPFMNNAIEMTGCLSSTTAFDHASGRHSPACQTAWIVSKKFEMDYSVFWLS